MKSPITLYFRKYKTAAKVLAFLLVAYLLRGFIRAIFSLISTPMAVVGGGLAELGTSVASSVQMASDKAAVKAGLPSAAYSATNADIVRYREAARALAAALGKLPGVWQNSIIADSEAAAGIVKQYGRARLGAGGKALVTPFGVVLGRELTGRYDKVLAPLYAELTNGRRLQNDLDAALPAHLANLYPYVSFYRKYVRVP